MHDLRFAFRQLAKSPGFTVVAILTLALAIGVNSAILSIVNGLMLRPTLSHDRGQIVDLFTGRRQAVRDFRQFSHAEFTALRAEGPVFADVAAIAYGQVGLSRDDAVRRSFTFMVSDNYFDLRGTRPVAGRFFSAEECQPGADIPVAVASHALWQRYGGRDDFVGSTIRVNDRATTIIGIAPEGFGNGNALVAPELWLPLGTFRVFAAFSDNSALRDLAHPKNFTLNLVGRLHPGLTMESASARLSEYADRINALHPDEASGPRDLLLNPPARFSISTSPENEDGMGAVGTLLLAMAGAVLLIACLNLANMLLARGTARAREIAIRLALGATRARVIRQLLIEGLLLAVAGGMGGLLLSLWAGDVLVGSLARLFGTMNFALVVDLKPDLVVVSGTFALCLVATLIFSLGPALRATRLNLVDDLKQQTGDPATHGRWNRFFAPRHCLVMAQVALSLMLLFGAGLFTRAALKAGGLDFGFDPAHSTVAELDYSLGELGEVASQDLYRRIAERAATLPGVSAAGLTSLEPLGNTTSTRRVIRADQPLVDPEGEKQISQSGIFAAITPGYLEALGVRLLQGRDFTSVEAADRSAPAVCIIDELMARALFPEGNALGQRIRYTTPSSDGSPSELEIVGIVNAHRHDVFSRQIRRHLYVPLAHAYSPNLFLHVRLEAGGADRAEAFLPELRREILSLDPAAPLLLLTTFRDFSDRNVGLWIVRLGAVLFGTFGVLALLLATIGVYAVKAYAVARRTREIGIRMALGAQPADVFALIMRQGVLQTGLAIAAGLILALLAGRALASMLYEVSPTDFPSLLVAVGALSFAALLACWLPARKATRVNPLVALRSE